MIKLAELVQGERCGQSTAVHALLSPEPGAEGGVLQPRAQRRLQIWKLPEQLL